MLDSPRSDLAPARRSPLASVRRAFALGAVLASTLILSACSGSGGPAPDLFPKVATPTVTALASGGISAARDYPFLAADFDLKAYGFTEQEFLIEGKANSYDVNMSLADLGKYLNTFPMTGDAKVVSTDNPYRTRMMVYRPTDPGKFNGTVIVEWVNATNTWDTPIHWFEQKNMILRDGYAYAWISNQDMTVSGANGLKAWSPKLYDSLDVTNGGKFAAEELSWDIFSQAAKAIRTDTKVLGGLAVRKVLAVGESQSAMRVSIYLNSHHPLTGNIYDGALVTNSGVAQRTDLAIPIIKILTETEMAQAATNETTVLQPDTPKYKTWFVTGSTHSNLTALLPRAAQYVRDFNGKVIADGCSVGQNSRVPLGHVYNAGIYRLEQFLNLGAPIPTSPTMQVTSARPPPAWRGMPTASRSVASACPTSRFRSLSIPASTAATSTEAPATP